MIDIIELVLLGRLRAVVGLLGSLFCVFFFFLLRGINAPSTILAAKKNNFLFFGISAFETPLGMVR